MQRHAALCHLFAQGRQEGVRYVLMHQQRFNGVTGARTLGLRVNDNLQRRSNLSAVVYHDMTHANTTGDHRNRRLLAAQLVQPRAAAWDQHVDVFVHAQHFVDQRAVRALNCLHGTRW